MKRAAVSVPSNIAEGSKRNTSKDFSHFLAMARGSVSELQTQVDIAKVLPFGNKLNYNKVDDLLEQITKMLYVMIKKFEVKS